MKPRLYTKPRFVIYNVRIWCSRSYFFFIEVSSEYCLIRSYTFGTTPGNRGTKIQLIIWPTPIIAVWIGFYST